jgi:hypothetical protein
MIAHCAKTASIPHGPKRIGVLRTWTNSRSCHGPSVLALGPVQLLLGYPRLLCTPRPHGV